MDVRGIEITNQLRSAIRAKLLELGVRYDEELPDYILVMVVNKKSRQQMHEDLNLFLEASTAPFVEWLHDQVLKKLQKVTVAKKKTSRDLVPAVIVKQEEEKKKRKTATSFLEDQATSLPDEKPQIQASIQQVTSTTTQDTLEKEKSAEPETRLAFLEEPELEPEVSSSKEKESESETRKTPEEKRRKLDKEEHQEQRVKSSVIKPRVTSVVSVKSRLGESQERRRFDFETRYKDRRQMPQKESGFRAEKSDLRSRLNKEPGKFKSSPSLKFNPSSLKNRDVKERLGQSKKELEPVKSRSVKNRLGPIRSQFSEETLDEEEEEVVGPVKSRIIAVNKEDKRLEDEEEEEEEKRLPSKVIVTPRPLKPLQPVQKRAGQSLLLRAIREANQSVVMQKNPEPSLTDERPVAERLKATGTREVGNNLSVCLNKKNRFVMEKIQVELTTDNDKCNDKNFEITKVTDEHLGVVKSLFQRGDNNHTFLVTLNGYNDEIDKEYFEDDDDEDEGLEMEVNENDEMTLSNSQLEYFEETDSNLNELLSQSMKNATINEGSKSEDKNENLENEKAKTRKRKLSPIVYTRSPSPKDSVTVKLGPMSPPKIKKPMVDSNVLVIADKSKDKCRYWPNCTLGNKCAYYHPPILCSAFPACKFGDKCAYQHPKCKFGISCSKPGCIFSHNTTQQCKYHPFCTKPGCTFLHPSVSTPVVLNSPKQRAKFTWKRQD